jgi:hypothetical protein
VRVEAGSLAVGGSGEGLRGPALPQLLVALPSLFTVLVIDIPDERLLRRARPTPHTSSPKANTLLACLRKMGRK